MIVGYFIRDGDTCSLVAQDEDYRETVVADGLSNEEAIALYWRKMAPLAGAPAAARAKAGRSSRRPPQLSLKL